MISGLTDRAAPWLAALSLMALAACNAPHQPASTAGTLSPDLLCVAPVPPTATEDPLAVSSYPAKRQRFMDCVARSGANGHQPDQQQLDQSLAGIGDDQLSAVDQVQQDVRGAVNRVGEGGAR